MVPALLLILAAAPPTPPPEASGERVAQVRILAPEAEAARLRPYVELKEGEPFRPELVRHAVELFYATGAFEDVRVWLEHGPQGVEVAFEPVPAPLLVGFEVDGDAVLSPAAIRRTSRLRDREALWPDRLERAARDVGLSLAALGYLEAQVTAEARPAPGGRTAVLHVHAGPLASVARVEVPGAPATLLGRLRNRTAPRAGEAYRRARADEAVGRLERVLRSAGYWRATVVRRESYDPHTGRVTLAFEVTPGLHFTLELSGELLSVATRHGLEKLLRDGAARPDVVEEAADRIEEDLRRSGHRHARVLHREEARPLGMALVFDVHPGPRAEVASVRIAGEEPARAFRLLTTRPGRPVEDRLLTEDARVIARALEEQGYPEAKVEAEVPEASGAVPVVFRVRAGPQVRVGSVRLEPAAVPAAVAGRELRLRVGEPYRIRDLARDRDDLLSAFHDAGYPQAEITPEVTFSEDGDQAQVVLHVQPGPEVTVDHVVVAGLDITREEVVRRELRVREGGPLGLGPLLESQRRLGGLGIFERVSLTEMDPESRPARSVVISTQEGPRTSVSPAIGYGERDGLRGSVEVTRRNLFGMDRTLSGFARVSFNGLRLLTTFREPYALGRPQEVFVTAFREEEAREAFSFVRYGALVQGGRTAPRGWSFVFRYTYQRTSSFNIQNPDLVGREFTNSTLAGPSSSIINDTRDDPLDPHRGRFLSADLQLSHALLGGDSFVKTFLQAATYERLHPRVVLAVGGRLGLGRTFGDQRLLLPRPDRFYAGGDYSLRGFRLDTVGPTAPDANGVPVATGGNALLLGSAELRVDTGHSFAVAAFSDVGNVYGLASSLTLDDLRYTAGVGLRYKSSLGPIRVDWGYKLNRRPEDQRRYEVHITLGNAF